MIGAQTVGRAALPRGHRWVVVDVETSGMRASAHRVLSVAALVLGEDGTVEREFSSLVDPGCDPGPVHIHNLTRERLAGAPKFEHIAAELGDVLDGGTLVAHNAAFDYGFLHAEFGRAGKQIPVEKRLCTLALSRRLELDVPNYKLATLAQHWKVQQLQAHDAYDDARVLSEVFVHSVALAESLQLPLPVVRGEQRQSFYPESVPRVPCAWKNPGRFTDGLVQGMKVVISGTTTAPRLALAQRLTDAGLDVMNSVSRQTSMVVCNDPSSPSSKVRRALAENIPVVGEQQLLDLLDRVRPGEPKVAPAIDVSVPSEPAVQPRPARPSTPRSPKPWAGRRVLLLGGTHLQAVLMRSRLIQLGARPALNFTSAVTDVLVLDGGDTDKRMPRVVERQVPLLRPDDVDAAIDRGVTPPHMRAETVVTAPVLARGEVLDLPSDARWSINVAWKADGEKFDLDVVAFLLGTNEKVHSDDDFVFYNNPVYDDGVIELSIDGSSEQCMRMDLTEIPADCTRIVVAAAIDSNRTFGDLGAVSVAVESERGTAATFVLDAGTTERTMVLTEIYRREGTWRLRAMGQGYDDDLAALAGRYGVNVDE